MKRRKGKESEGEGPSFRGGALRPGSKQHTGLEKVNSLFDLFRRSEDGTGGTAAQQHSSTAARPHGSTAARQEIGEGQARIRGAPNYNLPPSMISKGHCNGGRISRGRARTRRQSTAKHS